MDAEARDTLAIGPSTLINVCGYLATECRAITNKEGENVQVHALQLEKVPVHIRNLILYEYEMYAELQCSHMLRVLSAEFVPERSLLLIETRMCYGITLANLMYMYRETSVSIPEEFIWFLLVNVAEMLTELHDFTTQSGIERRCHFITPHNIFLSIDGEIQIFPATESLSNVMYYGQQPYLAPELLGSSAMQVTPQSDIWSLGKLLFDMCLLLLPASLESPLPVDVCMTPNHQLVYSDDQVCLNSKSSSTVSAYPCYSLLLTIIIGKCMSSNPQDRPSAEELLSFLPRDSFPSAYPMFELIFGESSYYMPRRLL
ncbi:Kinase/ NEK / Serine/threonine protein kinase [Giardia duodenalis assemblage B]|uniref:non-specific serine/threonine protein kinase n=1 Tax=Giardia duodenalis assemblage B TaxID=1394984 RepID=A0A132P065_GIAIN|nr:Kinase/ NEK / Serine/threonine protein kinase [Giardia intestinalis assemblage B]